MAAGSLARGHDKTLMLIHGMWSRPHVWANFRRFFEDRGYRVVTPMLRLHDIEPGAKPHPEFGTLSVRHYADDLEAEIRALGCRPFVIGHSMGGLLAQLLAARGLTRGAALLASTHCAPVFAFEWSSVRIFMRELAGPFWRLPHLPSYEAMRWGVLNGFDEEEARELYATLIPESGRCFFEIAFWYLDRHRAALINAADIKCPMLFMTGSRDRITAPRLARKTVEYFGPKARFELKPGHGHWLPSEPGWEMIAARAAHFFESEAPLVDAETGAAETAPVGWQPIPA